MTKNTESLKQNPAGLAVGLLILFVVLLTVTGMVMSLHPVRHHGTKASSYPGSMQPARNK